MASEVELGQQAFDRRSWREAFELLTTATAAGDLERLAVAAHLIGRDDESAEAWERAHTSHLAGGDLDGAARCAFWLAIALVLRGEMARGAGWRARAERITADLGPSCASTGYVLVGDFLDALETGDAATADDLSRRIFDIAGDCGDRDLLALGLLSRGQASMVRGDIAGGLKLFDEAMVSVTTGEVTPIPAGIVYCAVIESCMIAYDMRRAAEWTQALHAWCTSEPDLVPYRGQCLVHRSQLLQAHGRWPEASAEAERAGQRLADPFHPALGIARYQQGELHRLRGEFAAAADAYRAAAELGRDPAPGVALLRLVEGDVDAASAAIRRMVVEGFDPRTRPAVLAAAVEIGLAAGDVAHARTACDELAVFADVVDAPMLHAVADGASGAVVLAEGDPATALIALRRAAAVWRALAMPYEAARTRVVVASACRALDDHDAAELELADARATFEQLGAVPDLARLEQPGRRPSLLTDREVEVVGLVATGRTNRDIAAELVISEHTVARHLQNIFVKLGVSSRAAATAWAYEHDLVVRTDHPAPPR